MSRREEVERLKNVIGGCWGDDEECCYYGNEALDELAVLALESVPTHYTPREEVTEGWWSCVDKDGDRIAVFVFRSHLDQKLEVLQPFTDQATYPKDYTGFLPLSVEGIE